MLRAEALLSVVLQVCEALLFLRGRGLVMRGLSSHSVILTQPGLAKLTGLGFMVARCPLALSHPALPPVHTTAPVKSVRHPRLKKKKKRILS